MSTHVALLLTVLFTSTCWIGAAFLAPPTSDEVLVSFYKKVRPFGPGWARVRALAGEDDGAAPAENVPLGLVGWVAGCVLVWSALFTVGNALYGRTGYALGLGALATVSGAVLYRVVVRLWAAPAK